MDGQYRHWCGTIHEGHLGKFDADLTWEEIFLRLTEQPGLKYASAQLEDADGTLHLQVYTEWKKSLRLSELRKRQAAHWEPRNGTRAAARKYTRKAESRVDGPWEFGEWRKDGARPKAESPKARALAYISDGLSPQEIAEIDPTAFFTHHRAICELYKMLARQRSRERLGIDCDQLANGDEEE